MIASTGGARGGTIARDDYLDRIDGLVYGEDPRNGYVDGDRFVHPGLELMVRFPRGWIVVGQASFAGASSPVGEAAVVLQVADDARTSRSGLRAFLGLYSDNQGEPGAIRDSWSGRHGPWRGRVCRCAKGRGSVRRVFVGGRWPYYAGAVDATISSLGSVTDDELLDVEPLRLRIVELPSRMSMREYLRQGYSPVGLVELERLNRVDADEVLPEGRKLTVVDGPRKRAG